MRRLFKKFWMKLEIILIIPLLKLIFSLLMSKKLSKIMSLIKILTLMIVWHPLINLYNPQVTTKIKYHISNQKKFLNINSKKYSQLLSNQLLLLVKEMKEGVKILVDIVRQCSRQEMRKEMREFKTNNLKGEIYPNCNIKASLNQKLMELVLKMNLKQDLKGFIS